MSADNAVVVLRTRRKFLQQGHVWINGNPHHVWRVAHVQAFDNYDWIFENQLYNLGAYLKETFGKSPVFMSQASAIEFANEMANSIEILEYGVYLKDTDFVFYGDM